MNHYYDSDGKLYNQRQINSKLSRERKGFMESYICQCCWKNQTNDLDHTIDQKTCKRLHKTELIWDEDNTSWSCRSCHIVWENFKSGKFQHHKNVVKRMLYIKEHDPEGFQKRLFYITRKEILKELLN